MLIFVTASHASPPPEKMELWFLYMIRCGDGSLYTGITTDVQRRFGEHQGGSRKGSKYLKGKAPLSLVVKKKIGRRSLALQVEHRVKRLTKQEKEMFVDGTITLRDIKTLINKGENHG